ncbi:MAG: hypothetical protein HY709_12335 [Candidatus Latescibacteria bacterium]|nr:hypothetical protein [Candidatus Latescibacterota bacterium]
MRTIDYNAHNAEVKAVWDAYSQSEPIRVPIVFGINPRFTMEGIEANPRGITFKDYSENPQLMMERQLEHSNWIRHHIPQDAEMGLPADGWSIYVDLQNYYEAAWLGCDIRYYEGQVPDTEPMLKDDDRKWSVFDRGIPDPFTGGVMRRNWEFYDYFTMKQAEGYTDKDRPITQVSPAGLGTDGPVTIACNLRGATEFMIDLLADTDYALKLLDLITSAIILRICAYREHLDLPMKTAEWGFADDSIQMLSEAMYRDYIFPFHRRLVETFSEEGPNAIHLCGDSTRHFRFLRDRLNIQSFDTGYPVDFARLRLDLGPDVEIKGGPSTVLLQTASPEEVHREVRRILTSGITEGGRFILREGNNLPPGVPLENIWAMYEAGKEYGCYT